jgi:hypothetical protein
VRTAGGVLPGVALPSFSSFDTAALALLVVTAIQVARAEERPVLPGLCEASALQWHPCADGTPSCLLVGDNEDDDALYLYTVDGAGSLVRATPWRLPMGAAVGDIEALAMVGGDVIVVGSHSRKSNCERDIHRLRVARFPGLTAATTVAEASVEAWRTKLLECSTRLIRLADADDTPEQRALRDSACAAIAEAETQAGEDEQTDAAAKERCATTFNVEGAVTLRDHGGAERVWLGLRAPLVDGRAILLRIATLDQTPDGLTFDGIAAVELGGLGFRELTTSGESLYGLAGPVPDRGDGRVWRIRASTIHPGVRVDGVESIADIAGNAEGLAIDAAHRRAIVLFDGKDADGDWSEDEPHRCAEDSHQAVVRLRR